MNISQQNNLHNTSEIMKDSDLVSLSERRKQKCLQFGLKSLLHPVHSSMFPVNPKLGNQPSANTRNNEHFSVNWAKSESYRKSAIPYIQRLLNDYVRNQWQWKYAASCVRMLATNTCE